MDSLPTPVGSPSDSETNKKAVPSCARVGRRFKKLENVKKQDIITEKAKKIGGSVLFPEPVLRSMPTEVVQQAPRKQIVLTDAQAEQMLIVALMHFRGYSYTPNTDDPDIFRPQSGWGPTVKVDSAGLEVLAGDVVAAMKNGINITHDVKAAPIAEALSNICVNHSVDGQMLSTLFQNIKVEHGTTILDSFSGKAKDLITADNMLVDVTIIVSYGYVLLKAWQTREVGWIAAVLAISAIASVRHPHAISNLEKLASFEPPVTKDGEHEPQVDLEGVFTNGILGYMYASVVKGLGSDITLERFVKSVSSFDKYERGIKFTMEYVLNIVQYALDYLCSTLELEKVRLTSDPWPDCTTWLEKCRTLVSSYDKTLQLNWSLFNQVMELKKEGDALKAHAEKRRILDKHHRYISDMMSELNVILGRLNRASVVATGPRIEPVGVMIAGVPGVGKTTSSSNAMLAVTARILEPSELDRFVENHNDFIYNRVTEEEYFTGYHGQTVFYFDDIGQTRDVPGVLNSPYMEAIRAINSNNYIVHMAALPDKGTVVFNSKLVWATTNRSTFAKDLDSLYAPDAFMRRWQSYWCTPRLEFSLGKESDPKLRKLDMSLVDPNDILFGHLEWYPYDIRTGHINGSPLYYGALVDEIVALYQHKFSWGTGLLKNNIRTKMYEVYKLKHKAGTWVPQCDAVDIDKEILAQVDKDIAQQEGKVPKVGDSPSREPPVFKGKEEETLGKYSESSLVDPAAMRRRLWVERYISTNYPGFKPETVSKLARSYDGPAFGVDWERYGDSSPTSFDDVAEMIATHIENVHCNGEAQKIRSRVDEKVKAYSIWTKDGAKNSGAAIVKSIAALAGALAVVKLAKGAYSLVKERGAAQPQSSFRRAAPRREGRVKELKARKRGHAQRINPRDYTIHEEMFNPAEYKPQIGVDQQATDVLEKVFMRSMYGISALDNSRKMGYMTLIYGRVGIVPMHFWCQWGQISKTVDGKFMLDFTRMGTNTIRQVAYDDIQAWAPDDMDERDVVFLMMPEYFDRGPDIRKHFVPESMKPTSRFIGTLLLPRTKGVMAHLTAEMFYHNNFSYADYTLPDSFEYMIPTKNGDCGCWISLVDTTTGGAKLLGMHVAGRTGKGGLAVHISREEIDDIVEEILGSVNAPPDIIEDEWESQMLPPTELEPRERFTMIGDVTEGVASLGVTQIRPSVMAPVLDESLYAPAMLRKSHTEKGVIDPWVNARSKYNLPSKYIHMPTLEQCTDSYLGVVVANSVYDSGKAFDRKVYSFEDAVQGLPGVPFADGIPRNTSAGYPWNLKVPKGAKGKSHMFGSEGDYEFTSASCQEVRARVQQIVNRAKEGHRLKHIYADFLKDERRPLDKVATGKTRLVSGCPVDYLIATRMYFMDFVRWYMTNNVRNGSAVGVNVYGSDWTRIVKYMNMSTRSRNIIAGDFKSYDGSLNRAIQMQFLDCVNGYYNKPNTPRDQWEEDCLVRAVLFEDVVNSKHIVDKTVYEWTSSMPSGNFLTTVLNTFCNNIIIRYASLICVSQAMGHKTKYPSLGYVDTSSYLQQFEEGARVNAYGDDNIITIGENLSHLINQESLTKAFAMFGMAYVDESKEGHTYSFRQLDEITFLKRSFVKSPTEDEWTAPLDLEVVLEIPKWTKKKERNFDISRDNVDTCLRELSLHPIEVWAQHTPKLLSASQDKLGYLPVDRRYEVVRDITRSMEAYV